MKMTNTFATMKETKNAILGFDEKGRLIYAKVFTMNDRIITHHIEYDEHDNVVVYYNADDYSCTCEYTKKNIVREFKDSNGNYLSRNFDKTGKKISEINKNGKTTFEYDDKGRCLKEVNPNGSIVSYKYDAFGRVISMIAGDDKLDIIYAPSGNISTETLKPVEIHKKYDDAGNVIEQRMLYEGEEFVTHHTYDEKNQEVTSIGKNFTLINEYDIDGNEIYQKIDRKDGPTELFYAIYDDRHNLLFYINNKGAVNIFSYDADNNMVNYKDSDGFESWNTFDDEGKNLIHRSFDKGSRSLVRYEYDDEGKCVKEVEIDNENNVLETIYTFSQDRLSASVYHPDGRCETRQMDEVGNITKIFNSEGIEELFEYDFNGQEIWHTIKSFGNLILTEYTTYDDEGKLLTKTTAEIHNGKTLREEYGYDDAGNEIFYQRFYQNNIQHF